MKRAAAILILWLSLVASAFAQPVTVIGPITVGDCAQFNSPTVLIDAGVVCNSGSVTLTVGTTPVASGTNGAVLFDNAGVLGNLTPTALLDVSCGTNDDFLIRVSGAWQCGIVGQGLTSSGGTVATTGGVPANVLNGQTANYTLAAADCGKTVQLGGNSFFTLTVPAVAGFSTICSIDVQNVDAWTGGGRAKKFAGANLPVAAPLFLWPTQTITFKIENGAWAVFNYPGRARLPASTTITLNTDFTNGSDANDGLATGAGNALKSFEGCLSVIDNFFDFNGGTTPSRVKCLGSGGGNTDTQGIHQAFHSILGCNGGACILLDGNGGAATGAWQFYFGTVIEIRNITLSNGSGNCIESNKQAIIYILDAVTFGACTGSHVSVQNGAGTIEFVNSYTVSGSATTHIFAADSGSVKADTSTTVTISAPLTVTYWVEIIAPSIVNLQGQTFNLGGNVVTGTKSLTELNGVTLQGTATLAVSGAVNGTGNACRITVTSASLAEGQNVTVAGIGGATGCNTSGNTGVSLHIVDGTHAEETGTTFGGSYTSGGTVQIGMPGTVAPSVTLGGQYL